mgnify:CR=1 FL=1
MDLLLGQTGAGTWRSQPPRRTSDRPEREALLALLARGQPYFGMSLTQVGWSELIGAFARRPVRVVSLFAAPQKSLSRASNRVRNGTAFATSQ